ncbi:hypothetical protein CCAX7_006210 [Capsulimonas corticalis]|uniref:DUF695 domain-containing protein n=1 Tax=Capsulimonas corticalis TaxID=2219043 RepID=A0A402D3F1_9BACT|nr:DUF695 domain-containing protein [Capsulimonas corticalis]BDI28570.1 hypothetical protein CCAX7_006210 [Capsulimonas corticalis]
MWPFTKTSTPTFAPTAADGPWEVKKYNDSGALLVVRVNMGLKRMSSLLGYQYHVGVVVPFRSPTTNGLPSRLETIELDAIEHLLRERFEADGSATLALAITTAGRREFIFYAAQEEPAKKTFPGIKKEIHSHEVQILTCLDKSWEIYRRFAA